VDGAAWGGHNGEGQGLERMGEYIGIRFRKDTILMWAH
jgi:hypothetical protein